MQAMRGSRPPPGARICAELASEKCSPVCHTNRFAAWPGRHLIIRIEAVTPTITIRVRKIAGGSRRPMCAPT